jgi:3',5'-cyclic AMP phosphodiesterase CpdA
MRPLISVVTLLVLSGGLCSFGVGHAAVAREQMARGVVFHDVNVNRAYDQGDRPLPGIRVSNGVQIVATDGNGEYTLPVSDDTILFVIKPRGWQTPLSEDKLPQFFYVHKPDGSPPSRFPGVPSTGPLPESVNFALTPHAEPEQFQAILFGDTQPRNQQEVDWIAHDVIEELVGTGASFGVTLGDIVFDDLDIMQPLNRTIALLGIPWYNVIGNHDINLDSKTRQRVNETFERVYGPSWYSFDYGPTHFLVVDNIDWVHDPASGKSSYHGGIGEEQMQFIRTDLEQIPKDQMVVLLMHIPLTETQDRHGLYRLIEQRRFCISVSGHTHHHEHVWITDEDGWEGPQPHHHIINVTVCGSW